MDKELNQHKRSDSIKWIAVLIAIILLAVGVVASLIPIYTADKEPVPAETPVDEVGGSVIAQTEGNGVKLMSASIAPMDYQAYGVAAAAESAYLVTATVQPENCTNKALNMSFAWKNPNSEWATGKAVGEYFAVTKQGDNSWALSVGKAFGEQIEITVTTNNYVEDDESEANAMLKATCIVDYVKRVKSIVLTVSDSLLRFDSTTTIGYKVTYTDGTIQGDFTAGTVFLSLESDLYNACCKAITSGVWQKTQDVIFANLTSVTSQQVNVGKCTRFITATGNPGTGESQWQSAFRQYVVADPTPHATLSMKYSYHYQGTAGVSNTATLNIRFDADSLNVNASSVSFDKTNVVM